MRKQHYALIYLRKRIGLTIVPL